eukprot:GDKH01027309.1.p1 GENE.GDKH01027309.1~~GDKH01027309.1.p1  ORF type:complete len:556 (+),score=100.03 GDKH01027309.1:85-1752(+)
MSDLSFEPQSDASPVPRQESDFVFETQGSADEWKRERSGGAPAEPSAAKGYGRSEMFVVLTPKEIVQTKNEVVEECVEMLGISPDVAEFLLRHRKWRLEELSEDWFAAEDDAKKGRLLEAAGLPASELDGGTVEIDGPNVEEDFFDPITAEEVPMKETSALGCGHRFSNDCWRHYLEAALGEGAELALDKRCPQFKCGRLLPRVMWERFLSDTESILRQKFEDFSLRSFVDARAGTSEVRLRWCPSPGCTNAVLNKSSKGDVHCSCNHWFCIKCGDGAHQPISCELVQKWNEKNQSEAENVTWILVNTKICPKCKNPIEKNQGCMHMTCRCRHEFCWVCLDDWRHHTSCNVYGGGRVTDEAVRSNKGEEAVRAKAKESLERYAFFYERFRAHAQGEKVAQEKTLPKTQVSMEFLSSVLQGLADVEFMELAVRQIIDCRRLLKWSYCGSFFAKFQKDKKVLFEFQQGQLESYLDRLQELAENTDLERLVGEECLSYQPFFDYKAQLVNLTQVVGDFFAKMSDCFGEDFFQVTPIEAPASLVAEPGVPSVLQKTKGR